MAKKLKNAKMIRAFQREQESLALRLQGKSYRQIAKIVGYKTHTSAQRAINRALAKVPLDDTHNIKKMELERLDTMIDRLDTLVESKLATNDADSVSKLISTQLKVQKRRSELLGLNYKNEDSDDNNGVFKLNINLGGSDDSSITLDGKKTSTTDKE